MNDGMALSLCEQTGTLGGGTLLLEGAKDGSFLGRVGTKELGELGHAMLGFNFGSNGLDGVRQVHLGVGWNKVRRGW